jgi:arylsulfatase A-like enzyme
MRWPGRIPAGKTCSEMTLTMDMMPTITKLAGAALPDYKIDGCDIWPLMAGVQEAKDPHQAFFYYRSRTLEAVRAAKWKLIVYAPDSPKADQPELYDLAADIGETNNLAAANPNIVARLRALAEDGAKDIGGTLGRGAPKKAPKAAPTT